MHSNVSLIIMRVARLLHYFESKVYSYYLLIYIKKMAITDETKMKLKEKLLTEEEKVISQLKNFTIVDSNNPGGFRTKITEDEDLGRSDEDNIQDNDNYTNKRATEDVLENRLKEIRDALEKLDREEFGLCEECGKEISEKRLEYSPTATQCMECAK